MAYNFYNNWLDISNMYVGNGIDHIVNLNENFFNELQFDPDSLKQYRIVAAKKCAEVLGNKPALMLSGGADSQAMIQSFKEAKLDFDIINFTFKDEMNRQDSNYARYFCKMKNLKYIELEFNVLQFLQNENFEIGNKYRSVSPHFNAHFKMAEILKDMGYTGICCGGFAPTNIENEWGSNFTYNNCYYTNISEKLGIVFQGNFLSYTPELSWSIGLLTKQLNKDHNVDTTGSKYEKSMMKRYLEKVDGYTRHGFEIFPQPKKFTGFELVKKYYTDITNDGWAFEKNFRMPLIQKFKKVDYTIYKFNLSEKQLSEISLIYNKNFASTIYSTTGVG